MAGNSEGNTVRNGGATWEQPMLRLHGWGWRLISTAAAVAWMGLIFYLSSRSLKDVAPIEFFGWLGDLRDVLGHLFLYGVLGPLLLVTVLSWAARTLYQVRWRLIAALMGVLYGLLDEYHQSFVPERSASAFDAFIDSIGVVVGVGAVWYLMAILLARRRQRLAADKESPKGRGR